MRGSGADAGRAGRRAAHVAAAWRRVPYVARPDLLSLVNQIGDALAAGLTCGRIGLLAGPEAATALAALCAAGVLRYGMTPGQIEGTLRRYLGY